MPGHRARSLYQRQVSRLVTPSSHKGVNIVASYVNRAYGHLRMGRRLFHSSCDFLNLPETMPAYWRIALKTHGTLRGLVPYDGEDAAQKDHTPEVTYRQARAGVPRTVRVGGLWSIGRVLMEPLFYNPHLSGWWGAAVLDSPDWERLARDKKPKPKLCRWTNEREEDAREVYERSVRFAEVGVTHVVHLLGGDGRRPMAWREFRRSCHPNPPCDQHEYSRLIESLPEAWLITLRDAVLNRPRPIDWQECVRTSDLPGNAWTCMNDNGQGRRWVAPTQGEAPRSSNGWKPESSGQQRKMRPERQTSQ